MNKKETLELKRRFKKDSTTIDKIAGCYIDCNKNKVCKIQGKFLSLDEDEYYKYLEIAKKSLSGTIGNNLLQLEFPLVEEEDNGKQKLLMELMKSKFEDEDLLDKFYDLIIETYDSPGNYLVTLFHDNYDVPMKTKDNMKLDDSEEVYEYIICSICPVSLSKPALGYREAEKTIGPRIRDWVVAAPETAILFPAFTDRSTDIHNCMFYTKNVKEPHSELMEEGLGCKQVRTSNEKREIFKRIIKNNLGNDDKDAENMYLAMQCGLTEVCEEFEENHADNEEPAAVDENVIRDICKGLEIDDKKIKQIADDCNEQFNGELDIFTANDTKLVEKADEKLQIMELQEINQVLKEENADLRAQVQELQRKIIGENIL